MSAPQTRVDSKTGIVEQVKTCLHSGDYSRALDLLRDKATEFPDDVELSELEKLAQDGIKRKAEADSLITESQGLFAQQKSAEAIQLLRTAYELDKKNSLARSILANALVEHARSFIETDWLEAERLTNQALGLNPAHPTAKSILSLIVEQKTTSSVEDWVSQASKLQSSGDLFAALAWVAEGLAVHPHDPKLLQIQDSVQRDQDARRRQARRGDLEDLRRLQHEIDGATDVAAKQALAVRIQTLAAKHWTDGEILSIANALLLRLGLVSQESSSASPRGKGATVILHVPRPSAPKPLPADTSQNPPSPISSNKLPQSSIVLADPPLGNELPLGDAQTATAVASKVPPVVASTLLNHAPQGKVPQGRVQAASPEPQSPPQAAVVPAIEPAILAAPIASPSSQAKLPIQSNSPSTLIFISAAAVILIAATFFFTRRHYAPPVMNTAANHAVSAPIVSTPAVFAPVSSAPALSATAASLSEPSTPEPPTSEPSPPALPASSDTGTRKIVLTTSPVTSGNHAVEVSKKGSQDTLQQEIHIRKGEQPKLISNLQPQPRLASLTIQGGIAGATVFVDQTLVGTIQPDGTLSVSAVNPGDHTVELRKERFKPRQFKEHFVAGGAISLAAADAALEAVPGELKITFAPADAKVAIVKGQQLTIVSSGVPLNLAAGTYTLTARTADGFGSSSTLEIIAGQSKTLDLSFAPSGMSNWDDPSAWKPEKDSFIRKGGNFVLYRVTPASGIFAFSVLPARGRPLQWVFNYTDPKNYVLFQMDDDNFSRTVIRNGEKTDEIKIPKKSDKKSFRALRIRVSATEIVHQIKQGDRWTVLDRLSQPGTNLSLGEFGFYLPGDDQISLSGFAHYADLNLR